MPKDDPFIDSVRAIHEEGCIKIQVETLHWESVYEPANKWETVQELLVDTPQETIDQHLKALLENESYFPICSDCKRKQRAGYMQASYCMSCASDNHGIVY